ncbi:amylo-alpha-1,6-glucosidase [Leifsonia shinshuensis]|uniref:amylo-alpha-1,6-glucosidase n=1 Tax=Leifsonia shinshuensis TaxID=150026 RepID=UPI001F50800C|nr:glycogen debranching protein [Leifsonia shinshuensis]
MTTIPSGFSFDIDEIPFSHRGAWFDLSRVIGLHERADDLHLVSHQTGMHPVLRLSPERAGGAVAARVEATPAVLTWIAGDGTVRAAFDGTSAIRFSGDGLGMRYATGARLTPFTGSFLFTDPLDGGIVLTSYETGRRYRFTVLRGHAEVVGDGVLGDAERAVVLAADEPWEVAVEEFETGRPAYRSDASFDEVARRAADAFGAYAAALVPDASRSGGSDAAVKAAYVLWSATVRPAGFLGREAILMSKHWMDKVWSWDHCFNAIALAPADVDAALDQFLLPFDHQEAGGALPDSLTHSEILYNFVKPPIHGWAFRRIEARAARPLSASELAAVYGALASWTRFWLDFRRAPGHALPYYQHGNDSGWDNSTTFDASRVIESPDLAAFLLLQLDELSSLANRVGESPREWGRARGELARALFDELWTGDAFIARAVESRASSAASSLLNCLPIVLGADLPPGIADRLAVTIEEHLTDWGPATEPVASPLYESDGYWRGPIWAPSTALIEDGLRRAGQASLADRVADGFRRACEASGFAENFDAVTGRGLRDRAYTWTASVYLALRHDAAERAGSAGAGSEKEDIPA